MCCARKPPDLFDLTASHVSTSMCQLSSLHGGFSVVSLVAWLDGHEASPHDRAGEAELHGCVSEIRSLRRTMAWPRSVAGVARLLGRDQVSDPHGCVLEVRRLIRTVAWPRSELLRLIRTIAWPRSVACAARLLGRDPKVARAWVFECLCVLMYCSILTVFVDCSLSTLALCETKIFVSLHPVL